MSVDHRVEVEEDTVPLKVRFPIVFELEMNRHGADDDSYDCCDSCNAKYKYWQSGAWPRPCSSFDLLHP
jgi:hypothetical protein